MDRAAEETAQWRAVLRRLRRDLPANRPVDVRRIPMGLEYWGDCDLAGRRYKIRVNNRYDFSTQLFVLRHEWGHAVVWTSDEAQDEHGPLWAVAAGEAERLMLDTLQTWGDGRGVLD